MATSGLNRNELSETAFARSNVYHFLAEFYLRSPEEASFDRLLSNDFVASLPNFFVETIYIRRLTYYIERLSSNSNHMKKVILDYHNLFTTITLKSLNASASLNVTWASLELLDHIGVELQFLGFLCRREAKAWKTGLEDRAVKSFSWEACFIQNHFRPWLPEICLKMRRLARTDFYRGIAAITQDFVEKDFILLQDRLQELEKKVDY